MEVASEAVFARALQLWSRAASQGYSQARVRLGDYYYYGWGTPVDYTTAATQYRLATDHQRNPQAMFNLAYMHEQGLGLKQDLHLAKRFYDMAAETSPDAKVPVALALLKLRFVSTLKNFNIHSWLLGINVGESDEMISRSSESSGDSQSEGISFIDDFLLPILSFGPNWDLYLLTTLVAILGVLLYFRRPNQ